MINLLPPNNKRDLNAARTNTLLIRYNIAMVVIVVFMIAVFVFVYFYFNISKSSSEDAITQNQLRQSSFTQVRTQAANFRGNLTVAQRIFANQVNYSELLTKIAAATPKGVIIQSLTLDAAMFGKPTTITAYAKSTAAALALKESYAAQTKLFSNVNISSIGSGGANNSNPNYPINVTLNLTIQPGAAS